MDEPFVQFLSWSIWEPTLFRNVLVVCVATKILPKFQDFMHQEIWEFSGLSWVQYFRSPDHASPHACISIQSHVLIKWWSNLRNKRFNLVTPLLFYWFNSTTLPCQTTMTCKVVFCQEQRYQVGNQQLYIGITSNSHGESYDRYWLTRGC